MKQKVDLAYWKGELVTAQKLVDYAKKQVRKHEKKRKIVSVSLLLVCLALSGCSTLKGALDDTAWALDSLSSNIAVEAK